MSETSPVPLDERSDHKNMYNDVAAGDRLAIREDFMTCDNVVVTNPGKSPWGDDYYKCENVDGVATGATWPVPPCFMDRTTGAAA